MTNMFSDSLHVVRQQRPGTGFQLLCSSGPELEDKEGSMSSEDFGLRSTSKPRVQHRVQENREFETRLRGGHQNRVGPAHPPSALGPPKPNHLRGVFNRAQWFNRWMIGVDARNTNRPTTPHEEHTNKHTHRRRENKRDGARLDALGETLLFSALAEHPEGINKLDKLWRLWR